PWLVGHPEPSGSYRRAMKGADESEAKFMPFAYWRGAVGDGKHRFPAIKPCRGRTLAVGQREISSFWAGRLPFAECRLATSPLSHCVTPLVIACVESLASRHLPAHRSWVPLPTARAFLGSNSSNTPRPIRQHSA